jgi:hypothetical protein
MSYNNMFTVRFNSGLVVHTRTLPQAIAAALSTQLPLISLQDPDGFEVFGTTLDPIQHLQNNPAWIACHKWYPPVLLPSTVDLATTLFKWINPTPGRTMQLCIADEIASIRETLDTIAPFHYYHLSVKGYGEVRLYRMPSLSYTPAYQATGPADVTTRVLH